MIVDPWGTVLTEMGDQVGFVLAELDPDFVERVRRRIPSLEHRRLYTDRFPS